MAFIIAGVVGLLAIIISLYISWPLLKCSFSKDYKKLKADISLEQTLKKQMKFILIVPFCISLVFVILYYAISEQKLLDYIKYGLASAVLSIILISIYYYINREKLVKQSDVSYLIVTLYILSLIIPYSIYFVFISMILSDFKIPFKY